MTTKTTETKQDQAPPQTGAALPATQGTQALDAPREYDKADRRGFEDTTQSDVMIPRLALAQANSPQVTEGDPRCIKGMTAGDMFNSMTNENYGKEVRVQLLRKMPLRAMEFRSIDDGGGVIDPNVPLDDERLKWGTSGDKKADKPKATLFRDFLAVLLHPDGRREMIALSFKSSGIKAAKTLWGNAMMRNKPVFDGRHLITTATKLDPKPHKIFIPTNDGRVSAADSIAGEEMYEAVKSISAEKIDSGDHDDDVDFDVDELEQQGKHDPGM